MNMNKMSDVKVHSSLGTTGPIAIACIYDGARYHIWVDRVTHVPLDTKLYKNPLLEYRGVGYFRTRVLNSGSNFGKTLIAAMFSEAAVNGAFSKALNDQQAAEEAETLAKKERARVGRIQNASLELYEACKVGLAFAKGEFTAPSYNDAVEAMEKAIEKAEVKP